MNRWHYSYSFKPIFFTVIGTLFFVDLWITRSTSGSPSGRCRVKGAIALGDIFEEQKQTTAICQIVKKIGNDTTPEFSLAAIKLCALFGECC